MLVVLGVVLGALLALAAVVVLMKVVPPWVASTDGLKGDRVPGADELARAKARAEEIGRARTAFLAVLAGTIATVGAIFTGLSYRLNRQGHELDRQGHELDRAGQITERFTRAIDQIGETAKPDVRLGGIYALERIAKDSADDHPQVMEVLTAYLREHARWRPDHPAAATSRPGAQQAPDDSSTAPPAPPEPGPDTAAGTSDTGTPEQAQSEAQPERPELATDVQAVMSVLARRIHRGIEGERQLDLAGTDLRRLVLEGDDAHLERAIFERAQLEEAKLRNAHLEEAILRHADLGLAHLEGAHLEGATLEVAHLEWAHLEGAHLEGAILRDAHLEKADLTKARLEGANLEWAHLEEAKLRHAHLEGADLGLAHLERAHLEGAHLEGAPLELAQLEGAIYDDDTGWPDGFDFTAAGAIHLDEATKHEPCFCGSGKKYQDCHGR
jgi:uncharacterized protein YjbI with pentapeptide repeats